MILRLLLLCALVALANESAYGLGLGKIELHSALNQRLDADIALTNVQGLETNEIIPSLASADDFDRVGVDRPYGLTDLRFTVEQRPGGKMVVHISSTKPIVEPFLDFLVEVLWPNGRILREYTVLLDPPVYGKSGVEQLNAAPASAPASASSSEPSASSASSVSATSSASSQSAGMASSAAVNHLEEGAASAGQYGVTGPGDTLWKIALKVRPNTSVSVQQTMLAIKRANPDAFINDNINLLKAGRVLRIPDLNDMKRQSAAAAVAEVKAQNEAFSDYKQGGGGVARLDASRRNAGGKAGSGSADQGELRLLASSKSNDQSSSAAGDESSSNSAANKQLQDQLDVTKEDLDRAKRANTELNGRVSDLQDQITKLNELVKLKDDQLAALRAEVQKMQAAQAQKPATPAPANAAAGGSLLTNPYVLGVLALLLVGGVAGGMIFMRRRREMSDMDDSDISGMTLEEVESDAAEEAPAEEVHIEEDDEELSPQTSDAISEAEIYIAYGRFPQAVTFLQNAIEAEPSRTDLQLKLLEVYVQTEDATAFNLQLEQLKQLGDQAATARALELQQQIPGAADMAEAAMDATIVSNEPVAAIDEPVDDDDELSFDLDDLDAETEEDTLDLSADLDMDEGGEMDQDLDLDADTDEAGGGEAELSLDDDDLDLDLEADSTDDELSLDLDADDDTDLDLDLESAAAEEETAATDDDEITLDLGDDDELDLEGGLDLDDGDLDLGEDTGDDEFALNLDEDSGDDEISLDLDSDASDDEISLDLDSDTGDDEITLDLGDDDEIDLGGELDLGEDDDAIELDLGDDDDSALDLSDMADDDLSLDDDDLELNLDEDASTKLDLARAYIDMGDNDGARSVLKEVVSEGNESEVQEANELLEKIG